MTDEEGHFPLPQENILPPQFAGMTPQLYRGFRLNDTSPKFQFFPVSLLSHEINSRYHHVHLLNKLKAWPKLENQPNLIKPSYLEKKPLPEVDENSLLYNHAKLRLFPCQFLVVPYRHLRSFLPLRLLG